MFRICSEGWTNGSCGKKYEHISETIYLTMHKLAVKLEAKRRDDRGSIDFDLDEVMRSRLNDKGIPSGICMRSHRRRSANKMIEEFMLLANETVAEHFYWMEVTVFISVFTKSRQTDKTRKTEDFSAQASGSCSVETGHRHPSDVPSCSVSWNSVKGKTVRKRSQFCDAAFHAEGVITAHLVKDISDWH